jgi:protein phosphatase
MIATLATTSVAHGTLPRARHAHNQDWLDVRRAAGPDGEPVLMAVLADGFGGQADGARAARLAVDTVLEALGRGAGGDHAARLDQAFQVAAQSVYAFAQSDLQARGAGATCLSVLLVGPRLFAAHVGDSRLYLLRGGKLVQATVDHTFEQAAVEIGLLSPDAARGHPNRRALQRRLGGDPRVRADFRLRLANDEPDGAALRNQGVWLEPGTRLLLCTDGLSDFIPPATLQRVLRDCPPPAAVDALLALASQPETGDDASLIVINV